MVVGWTPATVVTVASNPTTYGCSGEGWKRNVLRTPQTRAILVLEGERPRVRGEAQPVDGRPEQGGVETRRQIRVAGYEQRERPRAAGGRRGKRQLYGVAVLVDIILEPPTDQLGAAIVELGQNEVALHHDGSLPVVGHHGDDRRHLQPGRDLGRVASGGTRRRGPGKRAGRRRPGRRAGRIADIGTAFGGGAIRHPLHAPAVDQSTAGTAPERGRTA